MESKNELLTVWNEEMDGDDYILGGKENANLGEMIKAGIPVSLGFYITIHAMNTFMDRTGAKEQLTKLVTETDQALYEVVKPASDAAMRLIETTELSPDLQDAIVSDYRKLCERSGVRNCPVAVRSSVADSSPSPTVSYLNVRGEKDFVDSVRRCWSSVYDVEAIMRRINTGMPLVLNIGVAITKMLYPRVSGVIFTLNPVNGDPSKITIDASYGLLQAVVSGLVTPDTYFIDKIVMEPVKTIIGAKEMQCVYGENGSTIVQAPVPEEKRRVACLAHQEALELARIGKLVENYYGRACKIEFGIDADSPFPENMAVLRIRPESVWSKKQVIPRTEKRKDAMDRLVAQLITGMKLEREPFENVHRPSLAGHAACCPLCTLRSLGR